MSELAAIGNRWHTALLNMFILHGYDMVRDQKITPKRLQYAKETEAQVLFFLHNPLIERMQFLCNTQYFIRFLL